MHKNITMETPERWVILKMSNGYKVFATWSGGYLYGDRWRINSGISRVDYEDGFYLFYGLSGSCYKCYKKGYGFASSYGRGVMKNILKHSDGKIKVMDDVDDWVKEIG